ncbi:helix-turn-helix domain-containing protein [Paenibacillus sp. 32O-W]|uniref:helix-turn-helix domain-containing protein n=1 Tax=Paenibacillus sp. 32O-W TaxID=1695218 RepID=UPI001642685D|nr:helix-turn-helix domain-containing protein [Paenibacillus sp. 32O-W]
MNIIRLYRSRKYLRRILLAVLTIPFVLVTIFSMILYMNSRDTALKIQSEADRKILAQINYNIMSMNEMVENLAKSVYLDTDMVALLYGRDENIFELPSKMLKLEKLVSSTSFLHSIIIYNANTGKYYSTDSLFQQNANGERERLDRFLHTSDSISRLQLIPISYDQDSSTEGNVSSIDLFGYLMYGSEESPADHSSSMVILAVKPEWLFDNLQMLNGLSGYGENSIVIVNGKGEYYTRNQLPPAIDPDELEEALLTDQPGSFGQFVRKIQDSSHLVSYMHTDVYGWTIVSIRPYEAVLGSIYQMRGHFILITVLFLLLSLIAAFPVSRKLYGPLENILKQLKQVPQSMFAGMRTGVQDEMKYLSQLHTHVFRKMDEYERDRDAKRSIVINYQLRKLILDSTAENEQTFRQWIADGRLRIAESGPYVLIVMKIDDYKQYMQLSSADRRLLSFAVGNISEELLSVLAPVEFVDMKNDQFTLLVSGAGMEPELMDRLVPVLEEVQETLYRLYRLSLTVAISQPAADYREWTSRYGEALRSSAYRMVFGKRSVVTPERIREKAGSDTFPNTAELEKRLAENLKAARTEALAADLDELLNQAARSNIENIQHWILHLLVVIRGTIMEINNNRLLPVDMDWQDGYRRVLEAETLEEVRDQFLKMFANLEEHRQSSSEEKKDALVDTICELIDTHYMDMDLSLQSISSMLKMSSAYVGRLFKANTSVTVTEYIHNVRLNKALELLEGEDYSIKEVMERVGYRTQSHFFKLFKSKYGTTPREYRLKRSLPGHH